MTSPQDLPPIESCLGSARGFVERRRTHLRFESRLLEVMSDAVIATDLELRVRTWNRAAEKIYGWTQEEALGQPLDALLGTAFLDTSPQAAQEQLFNQKTWKGLLRQHDKNGKPLFIQAIASLVEEDGRISGAVTINRDVTRLRQVDEALLRASRLGDIPEDTSFFETLVRSVAESLGLSWVLLGEEVPGNPRQVQTLAVWSHGALAENFVYALDGGPCGEVRDASVLIIPEGVVERFPLDLFLKEQGIDSYLGVALLDSQGRRGGILVGMDPRPMDEPGWLSAILKIYADRAAAELEKRRTLHALETSEARLTEALEGAKEGVWDWNAVTNKVYFSPRWKAMLGHLPDEVGDSLEDWSSRVHPEDLPACYADLDAHFRGDTETYQNEHRVRCKDGSYKWILDRGKVVEWGPDGKPLRVVGTHQDITERKTMEAALRTSDERLKEAAAQVRETTHLLERTGQIANVGGWQLDVASGAIHWSEEMFRIHELEASRPPTLEEAIHFIGPQARANFAAAVGACLGTGRAWDLELPLITAKGRSAWIHTQGYAEQEEGKTLRIFGTVQDITQRTHAEKALEASESLHRTLVETLAEGVLVYDARGVCITANEQACRILGVPREELLFKSPKETLPFRLQEPGGAFLGGADLPMHACRLQGKVAKEVLLRLVRPSGSFAWIELNARPLGSAAPLGQRRVVLSFSDITASHEAEQARLESLQNLEELRSAIDQANIYALTDVAGRILEVNDEFVRISGYAREELIGANHRLLKSGTHPDTFYRELWKTITAGRIWRGEIQNRAKNGHLYWVNTTIIPLRHPDGRPKGYMVFRQDATEQHDLQQALLQSQKLESVGTLVAGIAHDFNNILMSIGGFTEVLSAAPGLTPKQAKGLEVIRRASNRGRVLVSKLLNFSRKNAPQKVQADLNAAVTETAQLFKRSLAERIRLNLLLSPDLPPTLMDPDQVHQVLMNLCVNARDAILGEGELSIRTGRETLSQEEAAKLSLAQGDYLIADISDTGQGIPAMVLPRMFEPFFTTKGVGKGTGLGLSVVHGIIRGHGGAIKVDSELGVGSTFKVYLPLLDAPAELTLEPVAPGARGRLLLVTSGGEVEPELADLLQVLRFELLRMDQTQDWGSRIDWSDAVLLFLDTDADWAMAAANLKQGPKDVPLIVLTSTEDSLFRVPTLHHPVSAVLTSPPRRGELVDTLNSLVPTFDNR